MARETMGLPEELRDYVREVGIREPEVLARLREETATLAEGGMQVAPEEGAFLGLLVELLGARRCVEVGTFTGYSSTSVALALPPGGQLVCCDVSEEWTSTARRYWAEARVDDKIELRIGPALDSLDALLADGAEGTFDLAFVDADKSRYDAYYDRLLRLVRPGGLIVFDNMLWHGLVVDESATDDDTTTLRALARRLKADERVSVVLLPIADGVSLVRRR